MSLNRTKIEWTDATWNPRIGCYGAGGSKENPRHCPYCYARRIARRFKGSPAFPNGFEPTFHPDRLIEPYKLEKQSRIFACSMGDLFGPWLPENWTGEVLCAIGNNPKHTFKVLTKSPRGLSRWQRFLPRNLWLGVSVTEQGDVERIFHLRMAEASVRFVSFEPLLGPVNVDLFGLDWIVIGAQTRPARLPATEWVSCLLDAAKERDIPVFLKDNLRWPERIREFPSNGSGPC